MTLEVASNAIVKGNDNVELTSDPLADARLAAIVESSFDAIISKDLNSIIQTWNPAAERLFGYSLEEAIGQPVTILIPGHLQGEETEIIGRISDGERIESYETIRCRKDGSIINVSITVSPIRDRKGVIVGASKVARDITATKENERRIRLLLREINHRVKNQFSVINAIIRETAKTTPDPRAFELTIRNRILALARSHDLLVSSNWSGASLSDLIRQQLEAYGHEEQLALSGPPLVLQANAVQHLGMAFHELATNSAKYGALSGRQGRVSIGWQVREDGPGKPVFELSWEEHVPGLNLEKAAPRRGFGSVVLLKVAPRAFGGSASVERGENRLCWSISAPLEAIIDTEEPILPGQTLA